MRFFYWIRGQTFHVLPAFIFFFVAFSLITLTVDLFLKTEVFSTFNFLRNLLASLIVARVLLFVDNLPMSNPFPARPLIYNIIWKSFLYGLASLFVRFSSSISLYWWVNHETINGFWDSIDWTIFWTVQTWYFILFFVFVVLRDLILAIGPLKVRKLFFGR